MAIQNTDFPAIVDYSEFDPAKVNPGEIIIVNILGMHAVYIGTSAGKATRMAAYEEAKEYLENTKAVAKKAEETRANAAVLYELMQRLEADMKEELAKAQKAVQEVNRIITDAEKYIEESLKSAKASAESSAFKAEESAAKAEKALRNVNRAVDNLGETVRTSLSAIAFTGGK